MIDLPLKAEVQCSDDIAGIATHVIGNPVNQQITHLVVESDIPPHYEYLVPLEQVEGTTPNLIKLKCTQEELHQMPLLKYEEYLPTEMPSNLAWPYCLPIPGAVEEQAGFIPVEYQNMPPGEQALQRDAQVVASDGYIGLVDELLINAANMQVIYLVLLERHTLQKREITIPVSQIDRVDENTIYLKIDRQSVEELPTTPFQRWQRS